MSELNRFYDICQRFNLINQETQAAWIGSKTYSDNTLCQEIKLIKLTSKFKLIDIQCDVDLSKIIRMNYYKNQLKNQINRRKVEKEKLNPNR